MFPFSLRARGAERTPSSVAFDFWERSPIESWRIKHARETSTFPNLLLPPRLDALVDFVVLFHRFKMRNDVHGDGESAL